MTHEDALNHILANSCKNPADDSDDSWRFVLELHCGRAIVIAKPLGDLKYEIKSVEIE